MKKNMTCITCPIGCYLTVDIENGEVASVTGNTCKRGIQYAKTECTNPVRVITTTVKIQSKTHRVIPVKTEKAVPKEKLFDCLKAMKNIEVQAPIHIGEIIIPNICETGINLVATRNIYT